MLSKPTKLDLSILASLVAQLVKTLVFNAGDLGSIPDLLGKICWRRDRLPTSVFLGFPGTSAGKESACNAGDSGLIVGWEDPPEKD